MTKFILMNMLLKLALLILQVVKRRVINAPNLIMSTLPTVVILLSLMEIISIILLMVNFITLTMATVIITDLFKSFTQFTKDITTSIPSPVVTLKSFMMDILIIFTMVTYII